MMLQPPAQTPPPAETLLARNDTSTTLSERDTPILLRKAGVTERAVVRQQLYLSIATRLVRPAAPDARLTCRWVLKPVLSRSVCFSSITGLFSCTEAVTTELPQQSKGSAEPQDQQDQQDPGCDESFAPTAQAVTFFSQDLKRGADAMFAADRADSVDRAFRAAGVAASPDSTARVSSSRLSSSPKAALGSRHEPTAGPSMYGSGGVRR